MAENNKRPISLPPDLMVSLHQVEYWRHLLRFIVFVAIYGVSATIAVALSQRMEWRLGFLLIPFYILAAASLHGISLFTHEAVHGTLCHNRVLNDVCGALCAFPVLQTCRAYRVLHLKHHTHLGDSGDPDHYQNYTRWTWMVFIMNWLRLLIGYPVYISAIPILGWRQGTSQDRLWIAAEICVLLSLVAVILSSGVSFVWMIHGWLIPMLLINTMVNIRGMSQHTLLENASDAVQGTRTILTRPIVRFFMCNENYHLEHHVYPGIPWYSLPKAHQSLQKSLKAAGAPYIRSYAAFVWEFLIHSLRRSPLGRHSPQETK
jgi:fatty acid desaturase